MQRSILNTLTTLLLGIILAAPTLALADHLHEKLVDEIECELCSVSSPAVTANIQTQTSGHSNHQPLLEKRVRLSFKLFRLNRHPRGPPLLR